VVALPNLRSDLGGVEGDRTLDLIVANDALSQLSYNPDDQFLTPKNEFLGFTRTPLAAGRVSPEGD
jgi:hypothetical protein